MKHNLLFVILALAAATLACTINVPNISRLETGPTETMEINEPLPDTSEAVDVTIRMGAGKLSVAGGAEGLVEGEVQYNIAEWKPVVKSSDGSVTIEQSQPDNNIGLPKSGDDVVNEWTLKLGAAPMNLTIEAGAYDGDLDLSGIPLRRLQIKDGASSAKVTFDEANPEEMTRLSYETGASSVEITGLANANAAVMDFKGGAGSYTLDFSGELQRDMDVTIDSGVSSLRLVIPEGVQAKVMVSGGLNDVSTVGDWAQDDDTYTTSGEGFLVTIHLDMGVGSLTLVNK